MADAMKFRFRIRDFLVITAFVALFVGFYAPELRSLDYNARVVLVASVVITAATLVGFTPVWLVLYWLRRRSRGGQAIGFVQYAALLAAYLSGLVLIVAICLAVGWLVMR